MPEEAGPTRAQVQAYRDEEVRLMRLYGFIDVTYLDAKFDGSSFVIEPTGRRGIVAHDKGPNVLAVTTHVGRIWIRRLPPGQSNIMPAEVSAKLSDMPPGDNVWLEDVFTEGMFEEIDPSQLAERAKDSRWKSPAMLEARA